MAKDLIRIISGDANNPKGNAVFFCTLKDGEKKKVIAMYATNNPETYIEKAGKGKFEEAEKICNENVKDYKRGYAFQLYNRVIDYNKEKINPNDTDIIDLGEYDTTKDCEIAIMDGLSKYIGMYQTSLMKKTEEYFKKPTRFHDNNYHFLDDLNPHERDRYALMCHLVEQMTGALSLGETEDLLNYKRLSLRLKTLDMSPKYQQTIHTIIDLLEEDELTPEMGLFIAGALKDLSHDHYKRNIRGFE